MIGKVSVENVMPKWDVVQRIVPKHSSHCPFRSLPGDSCSENYIMRTSSCRIRVESTGSSAFTFHAGNTELRDYSVEPHTRTWIARFGHVDGSAKVEVAGR